MILTVLFVLRVYTNQRNYMSTISSQLETKSAPLILSLPQSSSLNSLINMKHKTLVNNTIQKTSTLFYNYHQFIARCDFTNPSNAQVFVEETYMMQ